MSELPEKNSAEFANSDVHGTEKEEEQLVDSPGKSSIKKEQVKKDEPWGVIILGGYTIVWGLYAITTSFFGIATDDSYSYKGTLEQLAPIMRIAKGLIGGVLGYYVWEGKNWARVALRHRK